VTALPVAIAPFPGPKVPEVVNVMSLIPLDDFLMHRVVLQTRESPAAHPGSADVSRETFLRKLRAADAAEFSQAQ
jgi:hypothetical protein